MSRLEGVFKSFASSSIDPKSYLGDLVAVIESDVGAGFWLAWLNRLRRHATSRYLRAHTNANKFVA